MAKYTDAYGLRYPEPSDNANVPDDIKDLALSVEAALDDKANITDVYTKGNFAVINTTVPVSGGTVAYPEGFTYENCVIISLMAYYTTRSGSRSISYYHPQHDIFGVDCLQGYSDISLSVSYDSGANNPIVSATCKIVLMKLTEDV